MVKRLTLVQKPWMDIFLAINGGDVVQNDDWR